LGGHSGPLHPFTQTKTCVFEIIGGIGAKVKLNAGEVNSELERVQK
jgi:hypothetical protein